MMNEELNELYTAKWDDVCNALKTVVEDETCRTKPAYPLLLDIGWWENNVRNEDWYSKADIRVMIFGRETNEWKGTEDDFGVPPSPVFNSEISMGAVLGVYENFYKSHYVGDKFTFNANRYGTFHYGFTKFVTLLNQKYPDKKIGYIWNNLVKIGKAVGSGFPGNDIYSIERKHFPVVLEEVKILKPDLIIFLTGTYDERIKDCFGEVEFLPVSSYALNEVAKVRCANVGTAYRTYHPSAHLTQGKMEEYYRAIVEDISF